MTPTLLAFAMPGPTEMIVIGVIAVLLFGRKLPKLAFDMGNSFTQFKKGLKEPIENIRDEMEAEALQMKRTVASETAECEQAARDV